MSCGPHACVDALETTKYLTSSRESKDAINKITSKTPRRIRTITRSPNITNRTQWLPWECRIVSNNGPWKLLFHIHERRCKTIQFRNCFVLSPACMESQTRKQVIKVTSITKNMRHTSQRDASIFSALTCRQIFSSQQPSTLHRDLGICKNKHSKLTGYLKSNNLKTATQNFSFAMPFNSIVSLNRFPHLSFQNNANLSVM